MYLKGPMDKGEAGTHSPQGVGSCAFHAGKHRGWPENQTRSQPQGPISTLKSQPARGLHASVSGGTRG